MQSGYGTLMRALPKCPVDNTNNEVATGRRRNQDVLEVSFHYEKTNPVSKPIA